MYSFLGLHFCFIVNNANLMYNNYIIGVCMNKEELQYKKMVNTPVKKLILNLAIPTTISMLITAIYNIADTYFVAKLGASASGAVGVVFSFMAIVQAIGFTLGMGGGSYISALLGARKEKEAQEVGSSAFYGAIFLGFLLLLFGILFLRPMLSLLGATPTVLPYATDYAKYIVIGAPIMTSSFVLNNLLRAEGKAKLAMIGLTTGGILNMGLDPLLINVFDLGISGAAIATLVSQGVSFLILLSMFVLKKSIIKLSIFNLSKRAYVYLEIFRIGFPSLCRQGFASLASILLNNQAGKYGGDPCLSALTIISKIVMIIFSVCLGIGQGYQPVSGYNYFSKNYKRCKEAMFFTFIVSTILMSLSSIIFFIFSKEVMAFFIEDNEVIEIGKVALRYQCIALPLLSLNTICNMTFQSTRKKFRAALLSCCRQGIFFIPVIIILPLFTGLTGVLISQALADVLTFIFSMFFFVAYCIEINKKIREEEAIEQ